MTFEAGGVARSKAQLAREASIELSFLESGDIRAGRDFLWPGQRIYVSHLPRQSWAQTSATCEQVAGAGFNPVPHVPVRLLKSEQQLDEVLSAIRDAGASGLLLIAGDYAKPEGPYDRVLEILQSGKLQKKGFTRISVAGHPEGHPQVSDDEIRRAQLEKARHGASAGLEVTLVTQFFFEARPFMDWAREIRMAGIEARIVAGLPGPASIKKLLQLARRCGVGPSIRALTARSGSLVKLLSDRDPEILLDDLTAGLRHQPDLFDGVHLYSFGGFLRTAAWLRHQAFIRRPGAC